MKPLTDVELENLLKEHNKGGAFAKQIAQKQTCWDSGIKILKTCGHMKVPKYHVNFEILADEKIKALQDYYPNLEWLAYLVGKVNHDENNVLVTDLVIPDSQNVSGSNVYNVEYSWNEGKSIIGVIHSHHTMGAFFSGTDDAYINQNHDVSIVVSTNQRSPIKGQVRMKTLCGSYILAEDLTFSVNHGELDGGEFVKEFTSKINSPTSRANFITKEVGGSHSPLLIGVGVEDQKLRDGLLKYYSPEDVEEFILNGEAEEELKLVEELIAVGVDIAEVGDIIDPFEDDEGYDLTGENQFQMSDEEWEEETEWDTNSQNGLYQIPSGVPIGDDEDEENVWDSGEEELKEVLH